MLWVRDKETLMMILLIDIASHLSNSRVFLRSAVCLLKRRVSKANQQFVLFEIHYQIRQKRGSSNVAVMVVAYVYRLISGKKCLAGFKILLLKSCSAVQQLLLVLHVEDINVSQTYWMNGDRIPERLYKTLKYTSWFSGGMLKCSSTRMVIID